MLSIITYHKITKQKIYFYFKLWTLKGEPLQKLKFDPNVCLSLTNFILKRKKTWWSCMPLLVGVHEGFHELPISQFCQFFPLPFLIITVIFLFGVKNHNTRHRFGGGGEGFLAITAATKSFLKIPLGWHYFTLLWNRYLNFTFFYII